MEFDWGYFFSLFSVGAFWQACVTVVVVSSLSWFIGLILGFLLACAKLSGPRWLKVPVELYIWFFRSVPLMVLLVFVYNLPQLFPATQPLLGIPFIAGLVSMTVTEAAYMAEIHRGGLLSVAKGQSEAGHALSFSFIGVQRLIIIPQAFRISLPTLINEYITIIKLSSILSVISLPELLLTGQRLYAQNFLVMETLLAVAVYYVMVVTVFTWLFRGLENLLDIQRKRPQTLNESECATLRQNLKPPVQMQKAQAASGNPPALDLHAIEKSWGQHHVLKGIDLKVENGEVISIIGPSGSGKTTLIRTINALESIDGGEIILYGEDYLKGASVVDKQQMRAGVRRIGMVFQGFNLFPHRTVLDNVMLAPLYHKLLDRAAAREQALWLLDRVGLLAHAEKYPEGMADNHLLVHRLQPRIGVGAGKRYQHQAYQRGKQQLWGERRIKLALLLPAAHRLQHLMVLFIAKTRVHLLAQHRHLADDLLHPQRREPRVFLRHGRQGFN